MPKIKSLRGRKILDSRGNWTVEVKLHTDSGAEAVVSMPQGASRGSRESVDLPVAKTLQNISETIAPALVNVEIAGQAAIDQRLIELDGTPNESRLGVDAVLAVSIACARAAAAARVIPLWQYLRELSGQAVVESQAPRLYINVINGGLHAGSGLVIQEYLVVPDTDVIAEAVREGVRIYQGLRAQLSRELGPGAALLGDEGGFAPSTRDNTLPFVWLKQVVSEMVPTMPIKFGIDAAASNINSPSEKLFELYRLLKKDFGVSYFEDPFGEDDFANFAKLLAEFGPSIMIVGDDLTVTNPKLMKTAQTKQAINAVIIKPNQIGTLTETFAAVRQAREFGWQVICSHRSGETNDDFIVDLAWGLGADGLKLGAPARGERVSKYNRLLEIAGRT